MENTLSELEKDIERLNRKFVKAKKEREEFQPKIRELDNEIDKTYIALKSRKIEKGKLKQSKCPAFSYNRTNGWNETEWKCLIKNAKVEFFERSREKPTEWFLEKICGSCNIPLEDVALREFVRKVGGSNQS